jgi:hypothetical protein
MQFACNKNRIPLLLAVPEFFISLFQGENLPSRYKTKEDGLEKFPTVFGLVSLALYRNKRSIVQILEAPSPPLLNQKIIVYYCKH